MLPAWVGNIVSSGSEDGPELESAVAALQASPLVKSVEKLADNSGIYATLWCIAEHKQRKSEQRQFTSTRKTFAECARSLLELIETKHSVHLEAAQAARAAAAREEEAAADGPSAPPRTAFAVLVAAQHVHSAAAKAAAAERLAAEALAAQKMLETQLEAANAALVAAEVEALRLEEEVRVINMPFVLACPFNCAHQIFAFANACAPHGSSFMRKIRHSLASVCCTERGCDRYRDLFAG